MESLFVLKGQLQKVYAKNSKYIDKAIQFVLALLTFYAINKNIGFMNMLANPIVTLGLAVVCAFLPAVVTVLFAIVLILGHLYTVSIGIMGVTAIVFLVMFIFYIKFSPKMAIMVLLVPVAFMLKIPYVIPIAFGLVGSAAYIMPMVLGTIVYYMIDYVKTSATALKGAGTEGMLSQVTMYVKQIFQSKEMWIIVIAFVVCLFLVYTIKRMSANHAWKIAMVIGVLVNIVVIAAGDIVLDVKVSYPELIVGNIVAVVVGLILELLFFAVDYSRGQNLQFEDDEYYYYVKAVPKIAVAAPEKTVKRINSREDVEDSESDDATEVIDAGEVRRRIADEKQGQRQRQRKTAAGNRAAGGAAPKKSPSGKPAAKRRPPQAKDSQVTGNTEHLLLTRSLQKELNLGRDNKEN